MTNDKAILIGHYTESGWKQSTRGRVYDPNGICPALCAGMGGGGNIVPTMLFTHETDTDSEPDDNEEGEPPAQQGV